MSTDDRLTRRLAEFVASTDAATLDESIVHQVKRNLIDYLAATYAGVDSEAARAVRSYTARTDKGDDATIIGTDLRASAGGAAYVNGTTAHALDLDDGFTKGACHPGAPIVSAALAAAEARGSSADALIAAIAVGYEVAVRLAGSTHPAQRRRGFHNTALVGTMGSAAAVASLARADTEQVCAALGSAASHASGILSFLDEGSEIKRVHAGKAARDGLVSTELVLEGLSGPLNVLDLEHGYFHAFAGGEYDRGFLIDDLGATWRMLDTYNKPYPCCRHVHGAIDAALVLRQDDAFDPTAIDEVRVETFAIAASHDKQVVENTMDAQMSLPYSLAVALARGAVGMGDFESDARADSLLTGLALRTAVVVDEDLDAAYPTHRAARVIVTMGDRQLVQLISDPYGEPANPMSDGDLDDKFRRNVEPVIGGGRASQLAESVWGLAGDAQLWSLLAAATV